MSCDADMAMDKHDLGPSGEHPDGDLVGYRTFDEGFSVDLPQPSTVADALLYVMNEARIARREFRNKTEIAATMENAAKQLVAERGKKWSRSD
jgi:hypothetical protein